jgi:DNA polymerase-3 subunit gamma/tau
MVNMSENYMVFTRKWRPQDFEQIIGQDQVTVPLKRAIELNRIMHAYLFSGPRGVGKTTTARVFAKALNCKEGPTASPCGVCDSCKEIKDGTSLDVIEIDGASNRGIDRIRELREQVGFSAARSRYKVYIIDEVHMLTPEAWNALLKTLEEPPSHVIFVFATTDPQNIPQTILSRCQHFRFKRAALATITQNLKMIAKNEKIDAEEDALYMIAKAGDGALRDGQRIFDQAVTYVKGGKLTASAVSEMLGEIETEKLNKIINAVINRDLKGAITVVESVIDAGYDLKYFVRELIELVRNILIMKSTGVKEMLTTGDEEIGVLSEFAAKADKNFFLVMLQKTLETEGRISRSSVPGIVIEAYIADLILSSGEPIADASPVIIRADKKKPVIEPAPVINTSNVVPAVFVEPEHVIEEENKKTGMLIADEIDDDEEIKNLTSDIVQKRWDNIIKRAGGKEYAEEIVPSLENVKIISFESDVLTLLGENPFLADRIKKNLERLKELLKEEFKRDLRVIVYEKNEYMKKKHIQKEITDEEAMNIPAIKELGKIFKIQSVEVKKTGGKQ